MARTGESIDFVCAVAPIPARVWLTVVDVKFTVFARKSCFTLTAVTSWLVGAHALILAGVLVAFVNVGFAVPSCEPWTAAACVASVGVSAGSVVAGVGGMTLVDVSVACFTGVACCALAREARHTIMTNTMSAWTGVAVVNVRLALGTAVPSNTSTAVASVRVSAGAVFTWVAVAEVSCLAVVSTVSGKTSAPEGSVVINTSATILTQDVVAVVCSLASIAHISRYTEASDARCMVNASTSMLAFIVVAMIYHFAVFAGVSRPTLTGIVVDTVVTRSMVTTRVMGAVIDVGFTIFTCVS